VAITNRKQLSFVSEDRINKKAIQAYETIKENENLIKSGSEFTALNEVGKNVTGSVEQYFKNMGQLDTLKDYNWEFILIDDKETLNAWCMPGGKIAVYTGILDVTKNLNGLAAVMGHEIAHAVAKHSIERASRNVLLNTGTQLIDIFSGGKLSQVNRVTGMNTVGLLSSIGITNPFNRKQESEADYLGMIFSSLSGYDIRETPKIWERMKKLNKGKDIPEFMSTHPSAQNRIKNINEWMNKIILDYPPIKL
jgi:predicted Zn-dependent protease